MRGDGTALRPDFGEKGKADPRNTPKSNLKSTPMFWTDDEGVFWMYSTEWNPYQPTEYRSIFWKLVDQQWTWMERDTLWKDSRPVYGTLGVADSKNTPGVLLSPAYTYHKGALYVFGGVYLDINRFDDAYLNNLWKWDGSSWTWLAGPGAGSTNGFYGEKGVADDKNMPRGRHRATSWMDDEGDFWLFGGNSFDESYLNDLWKWDGAQWTWMSGSNRTAQEGIYGKKGVMAPHNVPGARSRAMDWIDDKGNFHLFGGTGSASRRSSGTLNDHWQWNGTQWTWLKGDSTANGLGHFGTRGISSLQNVPSSRYLSSVWSDPFGRVWLFGGSRGGDDLWLWQDGNWTWVKGNDVSNVYARKGQLGIEDELNTPGSRSWPVYWAGNDGNLWLYSGWVSDGEDFAIENDLWRLRQEPFTQMVVLGNGVVIEDQDNTTKTVNNTHFGKASITNVPIKRKFVIGNQGNDVLTLTGKPMVIIGSGSSQFQVFRQPLKNTVLPGDTLHFTIAFDPNIEGLDKTTISIAAQDRLEPYTFAISGLGTPPNINLIDEVTCSDVRLFIKKQNVDHYTVLISDSGKTEFPVNGLNYNYSPNYLKAPLLDQYARILYQGPKNELNIESLISGRVYQLVVVPGNGVPGSTQYFKDSSSILYFRTPASTWQDSIQITPGIDSGICETDTLLFEGASPFPVQWNDGPTVNERRLIESGEYYFLSMDLEQCWMSSDSVNLASFSLPTFDSISVRPRKPWCEGDTLNLDAYTSHGLVWDSGEEDIEVQVTESGTYSVTSTSFPGCTAYGSIDIKFNPKPNAHFLSDVFESIGEEIELAYFSDGADIQWLYKDQIFENESELKIKEDGDIRLWATSAEGCQQMDTAEVIRREVVLRAIPSAFSPNDDGTNDVWFFLHENDTGLLTVFNRWGGVMYQGVPQWNGKIFEEPVPSGIYFYHYRTEEEGKEEVLSGKVQVIR